jgi:hypothetical protein
VGFFLGTRRWATPLGELTRPTAVGGAPIEVRTSQPGQECQPTHLTRRAPPGDPPGGDRLTRWQMSLCSLCSSSQQRSPQGSTQADDGRELAALYAFTVGSRPNGGKAEAQPRGKDANSSQSISNELLSGYNATAIERICKTNTEDQDVVNETHADTTV